MKNQFAQQAPIVPAQQLAVQWLQAIRMGEPADSLMNLLAQFSILDLQHALQTDAEKMAFWINVYNAGTQWLLVQNNGQYVRRQHFFKKRSLRIAGIYVSLNDIEHGILRRSTIWWSQGYLKKWFPRRQEKELRVAQTDYRIHFALNCGAASCPAIAFYSPPHLDQQLALATKVYMKNAVHWDIAANTATVPKILYWFKADFGGKKGILSLLQAQHLIPEGSKPRLKFAAYDWSVAAPAFLNE